MSRVATFHDSSSSESSGQRNAFSGPGRTIEDTRGPSSDPGQQNSDPGQQNSDLGQQSGSAGTSGNTITNHAKYVFGGGASNSLTGFTINESPASDPQTQKA